MYAELHEIEREQKFLLNKELYMKINDAISWEKEHEQINYYYMDEQNILRDKNITVRIRNKEGKNKLQIKVPVEISGSLHEKKEYQRDISEIPKTLSLKEIEDICGFSITELHYIGKLYTRRKIFMMDPFTEVCLDYNEYLGIADYELEIEHKSEIKDLRDFFETFKLPIEGFVAEGKNTRFLKRLDIIQMSENTM